MHRDRTPKMLRLATSSPGEVTLLQRIQNVVRRGRVQTLVADRMVLDQSTLPVPPDTVFIDRSASAVERQPVQPIFQSEKIVLQRVRLPQPA
jgi:hypothetical protein